MNRVWVPSELATPERVAALLAGDDLDEVTREHLQQRLHGQLNPVADPFAGVVLADPSWDEVL